MTNNKRMQADVEAGTRKQHALFTLFLIRGFGNSNVNQTRS